MRLGNRRFMGNWLKLTFIIICISLLGQIIEVILNFNSYALTITKPLFLLLLSLIVIFEILLIIPIFYFAFVFK